MDKIQILSTVGSIALISFIIILIKNRKLKEEYSLLWLLFSSVFLVLSIWKDGLEWFARLVGIAYAPAALFLILIMTIFVIMIEFSMIISKQSEWIKQSAQHIGIINLELCNLQRKNETLQKRIDQRLPKEKRRLQQKQQEELMLRSSEMKKLAIKSKNRAYKN